MISSLLFLAASKAASFKRFLKSAPVKPDVLFAKTLIKEYTIEATDCHNKKHSINVDDNHQRMVKHKVNWKVNKIKLIPITTHGDEAFRIFRFDFK